MKFAILLPITVFSQQKTIVPLFGTIVFESKDIITNEKLYKESFNDFKDYIISAYAEETIKINAINGATYPYDSEILELDFMYFFL